MTFLGYATGTYSSSYVTSAETLSNPINIGNAISSISGPFSGISFEYATKESTTFTSADVVSQSDPTNEYLIWQATVENTANASVTILDYSFVLAARVAQEQDFYIVQPVSSWTSTTLGAYACANTATGGGPTGASCPTTQTQTWYENCPTAEDGCIPTGDTVSLDFAASGISGTGWQWGTSGGFNPPEVITMFAIIEYDYYTGGAWHVLAQSIPFTGTYVTG